MKYQLDEHIDRFGTGSIKYDSLYHGRRHPANSASMWVADMDFSCPQPLLDAARAAADTRIFGYTDPRLTPGYFRDLCDYYRRNYNWYINSRDVLLTNGVVPGIEIAINNLTRQGEGIIIQRPVYYPFTDVIKATKRTVCNNALVYSDGNYTMDFADLEKKAAKNSTTMMVLCSPHNPVGRAWTREELSRVYDICTRNNVIIVSDEIHCDLARFGEKHIVLQSLFPNADNIITCTAPSKTFNIPGFACSHLVVRSPALRERLAHDCDNCINPVTAAAVRAAFRDCDDWRAQVAAYIDNNFEFLDAYLARVLPKAKLVRPQATYLAWIDVSEYTRNTKALEEDLFDYQSLHVEAGDIFGNEGAGFLRANLACPTANVRRLADALSNQLLRLHRGDAMPAFALNSAWHGERRVDADAKKKVIVFARHVGCPFTQLFLARLSSEYEKFTANKIRLVVVTQNSPTSVEARLNRGAVKFEILCDPYARSFAEYRVGRAVSKHQLVSEREADDLMLIEESNLRPGVAEGDPLVLPAVFCVNTLNRLTMAHYARSASDLPSVAQIIDSFNLGGLER